MPTSAIAAINSDVAIGRWMKGAEIFIGRASSESLFLKWLFIRRAPSFRRHDRLHFDAWLHFILTVENVFSPVESPFRPASFRPWFPLRNGPHFDPLIRFDDIDEKTVRPTLHRLSGHDRRIVFGLGDNADINESARPQPPILFAKVAFNLIVPVVVSIWLSMTDNWPVASSVFASLS